MENAKTLTVAEKDRLELLMRRAHASGSMSLEAFDALLTGLACLGTEIPADTCLQLLSPESSECVLLQPEEQDELVELLMGLQQQIYDDLWLRDTVAPILLPDETEQTGSVWAGIFLDCLNRSDAFEAVPEEYTYLLVPLMALAQGEMPVDDEARTFAALEPEQRQSFLEILPQCVIAIADRIHLPPQVPERKRGSKISRNAPCPCGSGKKYKKCCLGKTLRQSDPNAADAL